MGDLTHAMTFRGSPARKIEPVETNHVNGADSDESSASEMLPTWSATEAQRPRRAGPRHHRVLIVDDSRDAADSLGMMLETMGHEIRTAYDGLEAVDAAKAFRPHVILLDLGMPSISGYEACRRIREQPWGRGMAIIALTGWGEPEVRRRAREAGFDLHLVKPADPVVIEQLVASLVLPS